MKYLSFKIILFCIFLPPFLFVAAVYSVEGYLRNRYQNEIESIYIGDTKPLLEGRIRLQDAVNRNIDGYIENRLMIAWGGKLNVSVITGSGILLYPAQVNSTPLDMPDPIETAGNNYRTMSKGLLLNVDFSIPLYAPFSLSVLAVCIFMILPVLTLYYNRAMKKAAREEKTSREEMERLLKKEREQLEQLSLLEADSDQLSLELSRLKDEMLDEKEKFNRNEDEMLEEIERLEAKLKGNLLSQETQQEEIAALKEEMQRFEKRKKEGREIDIARKRFKAIYKNIGVHDRAIEGYMDLTEDLKIKAEEIIHQLNDDSKLVTIKRKVFGKKNRETVLEVLFAYKGRLYFRNTPDQRIEVLAIGTKNTQSKELEFLNNL